MQSLFLSDQSKQDVFGADVSVPHAVGNALCRLQCALAACGDVIRIEAASDALTVNFYQFVAYCLGVKSVVVENGLCCRIVGLAKAEQNMLRTDECVSHILRAFK